MSSMYFWVAMRGFKLRVAASITLIAFLGGCKLALVSVEGGAIYWGKAEGVCQEHYNCIIEINDADFFESFTAVPAAGYEFSHWKEAPGFLCGGSTNGSCIVDNRGLAGNPDFSQAIASPATILFLMPVFTRLPDEPPPGALSDELQAKYNGSCFGCHAAGSAYGATIGAPSAFDVEAWAPRLAKGMEALVSSVTIGLNAMPARGNCFDCSPADYEAIIRYLSGPES